MANLNSNVAHAKGNLSRSFSDSSIQSDSKMPVKKRLKTEDNTVQSIFDLGNLESHRAVVLDNQELFQEIQTDTVCLIDNFMKNNPASQNIKDSLYKKKKIYSISNLIDNSNIDKKIQEKIYILLNHFISQLKNQKKNPVILKLFDEQGVFQIGTNISNDMHKDNGAIKKTDDNSQSFDYTIVIPILDYDLSGSNQHNFNPESTKILPMNFKSLIPQSNKKNPYRGSVFYEFLNPNKQAKIEKYFVSEPLKQGTAVILHTTTEANSDDDGKSVIHQSPETPSGFARCFIFARANKI